jgi:hypothetical protein
MEISVKEMNSRLSNISMQPAEAAVLVACFCWFLAWLSLGP